MDHSTPRYPYESPVTAYGNGGFRFADMSHRGSILCTPAGIFAWDVAAIGELDRERFEAVIRRLGPPVPLLLGTGETQVWPGSEIYEAAARAGVALEPMSTGAAARTYNILIAEKRAVAAALIAVP
jgi:uncharacterized protein